MGNSPTWRQEFHSDYEMINDHYQDQNFGKIGLFKRYKDKFTVMRKAIQKVPLSKETEQSYERRMRVRSPYLIKVLHIEQPQQDITCMQDNSIYQILYGYWEYPGKKTLDDVLKKKKSPWTESQIWLIIFQLVSAGADLQKLDLYHGDLRPASIFTQDDRIKIAEFTLVPELLNGYQRALMNTDAYLSPQQMESLQRRSPRSNSDPYKNDVYTLGMTILYCASLTDPKRCYDMNTFEILESEIHNLQRSVSGIYSACLLSFIQYCLTPSENSRPSFIEALATIKQFEKSILDLSNFYENIIICNCQDNQHYQVESKIMVSVKQYNQLGHVIEQTNGLPPNLSQFSYPQIQGQPQLQAPLLNHQGSTTQLNYQQPTFNQLTSNQTVQPQFNLQTVQSMPQLNNLQAHHQSQSSLTQNQIQNYQSNNEGIRTNNHFSNLNQSPSANFLQNRNQSPIQSTFIGGQTREYASNNVIQQSPRTLDYASTNMTTHSPIRNSQLPQIFDKSPMSHNLQRQTFSHTNLPHSPIRGVSPFQINQPNLNNNQMTTSPFKSQTVVNTSTNFPPSTFNNTSTTINGVRGSQLRNVSPINPSRQTFNQGSMNIRQPSPINFPPQTIQSSVQQYTTRQSNLPQMNEILPVTSQYQQLPSQRSNQFQLPQAQQISTNRSISPNTSNYPQPSVSQSIYFNGQQQPPVVPGVQQNNYFRGGLNNQPDQPPFDQRVQTAINLSQQLIAKHNRQGRFE